MSVSRLTPAKLLLCAIGLLMSSNVFAARPPKLPALPEYEAVLRFCPNTGLEWTNGDEPCPLKIGDTGPGGGIVFYIDGDAESGIHGLEAAPVDQSGGVEWGCYGTDVDGVDNIEFATTLDSHSGSVNTPLIVAACGGTSAAGVAANYVWPALR
ncbi:MAG: hypothetical protein ACQ9MH_15650 [Nitrospinales bacterium]